MVSLLYSKFMLLDITVPIHEIKYIRSNLIVRLCYMQNKFKSLK